MMLGFVTARSFHPFTCQIEHIALGIFLRETVIPQAVGKADLIAPFIEFPGIIDRCLEEVFGQFVPVMAVHHLPQGEVRVELCFVQHIASPGIDGTTSLQVDSQTVPSGIELVTALAYIGAEVTEACSVGKGTGGCSACCGKLLLLELTFVMDIRALAPDIYIMVAHAVINLGVEGKSRPGRGHTVDGHIPSLRLCPTGYDIDDAHIAIGLILGRGSGKNLDITDIGSTYHLQGFCARKGRNLPIYIYQEVLTAAIGKTALGIQHHTRDGTQHIQRRPALGSKHLRGIYLLTVQTVADALTLSVNAYLAHQGGVFSLLSLQGYGYQKEQAGKKFLVDRFHVVSEIQTIILFHLAHNEGALDGTHVLYLAQFGKDKFLVLSHIPCANL